MSDDGNQVRVRSLKYFHGEPSEGKEGRVAPGDELTASRPRAAELRANGLIEYTDPADVPVDKPADASSVDGGSVKIRDTQSKSKPADNGTDTP